MRSNASGVVHHNSWMLGTSSTSLADRHAVDISAVSGPLALTNNLLVGTGTGRGLWVSESARAALELRTNVIVGFSTPFYDAVPLAADDPLRLGAMTTTCRGASCATMLFGERVSAMRPLTLAPSVPCDVARYAVPLSSVVDDLGGSARAATPTPGAFESTACSTTNTL